VEVANFEIASDAFSSFKDLLTRHKAAVAAFLADHYSPFFDHFYALLQSSNYVTRRQSLKVRRGRRGGGGRAVVMAVGRGVRNRPRAARGLRHSQRSAHGACPAFPGTMRPQLLGQLLLESPDVRLMMRYVSDVRNLMLMMNLLKDSSRSIQFEAFHVFKVAGVGVVGSGALHGSRQRALVPPPRHGRGPAPLRLMPPLPPRPGVCCQPRQAAAHQGDPHKQQGQAAQVPGGLPAREGWVLPWGVFFGGRGAVRPFPRAPGSPPARSLRPDKS
jgi:hypothetical protein